MEECVPWRLCVCVHVCVVKCAPPPQDQLEVGHGQKESGPRKGGRGPRTPSNRIICRYTAVLGIYMCMFMWGKHTWS